MADRIPFSFVGTTSKDLALDPDEFKGRNVREVTGDIRKTLRDIAPDVSFFTDDIELAAEQVVAAVNGVTAE